MIVSGPVTVMEDTSGIVIRRNVFLKLMKMMNFQMITITIHVIGMGAAMKLIIMDLLSVPQKILPALVLVQRDIFLITMMEFVNQIHVISTLANQVSILRVLEMSAYVIFHQILVTVIHVLQTQLPFLQ